MRVRFLGFDHTDSYRSSRPGCESVWSARVVRDVPSETADYLTATFPGAFKREGGRPRKTAPSVPPVNRAMTSPPGRPLVVPDPTDILDGSVPSIVAALRTGAYDGDLDVLESAEQAGKTRKGVGRAIGQRRAAVGG